MLLKETNRKLKVAETEKIFVDNKLPTCVCSYLSLKVYQASKYTEMLNKVEQRSYRKIL